eukprot:233951-Chlamydomonas_euryale.AAC.1
MAYTCEHACMHVGGRVSYGERGRGVKGRRLEVACGKHSHRFCLGAQQGRQSVLDHAIVPPGKMG